MSDTGHVINAMIAYYEGDPRRTGHFLKVYGFAKAIGEAEGLSENEQSVLEIAALVHDIGIKTSEIKYNSTAGPYQEAEGPPEAEKLLERLGFDRQFIDRVCWLIAHHHTYGEITARDHRILVEADFLVNAYEDNMPEASVKSAGDKVFQTITGKRYLELLYISH